MFTTNVFDYTNILDKAADASWMRENVITNNIANIDTPGYKRQEGEGAESGSGETYNDILYRCGKLFLST